MIPTAVCPRRFGRTVILLIGLLSGTVLYPIVGNWLWGGGWLASVGLSLGLGHGLVDFGGASVIFLTGSIVAFTALFLFKSTPAEQDDKTKPAEVVVITGLEHQLTVYDEPEDTPQRFYLPPPCLRPICRY